jgi:hypothetical protein
MWNAARIGWQEQVLLLWILLPATFAFAALVVFAAPYLSRGKK